MPVERTLIIGDVHGCYDELCELIHKLDYDPLGDRLIFLGDLINKGPKSREVLEFVLISQAECIMGNHELGFINYLENNRSPRRENFERLIEELGDDLDFWAGWIKSLPLYIEEDDFLVVHAGLVPWGDVSQIPARIITRVRTWDGEGTDLDNPHHPAWYELYGGQRLVVYGRWASEGLLVRENTIGLDSGCVWGGKLSALILPDREIVSVKARKAYCDWRFE